MANKRQVADHWEHFPHAADIGVRGVGHSKQAAFEQAARGLMAAITEVGDIAPERSVSIRCSAPDSEALLVEWLNAVIYEVAVRRMLFCRFDVHIDENGLAAQAVGESIDPQRHERVVEAKGATYTELSVRQLADGRWLAQCVVDV